MGSLTRRVTVAALAVALSFACAEHAAVKKDTTGKPGHVVVLVHGVGGAPADFGSMEQALTRHLNIADDRQAWDVVTFGYDTDNRERSTQDFARLFAAFLRERVAAAGPDARFSIVSHSQGGLVTSLLVANSLTGLAGFSPGLMKRMDAWVTIATPFWGAKSATIFGPIANVVNRAGEVMPGNRQLKDMSFGSDTIYALRHAMRLLHQSGGLAHLRVLNLAGYVPGFKSVAPFSAGANEFEDDMAVLVPSARMDFLYAVATEDRANAPVPASSFVATSFADFGLVIGMHGLPFEHVQSLVEVPERCIEHAGCDHPTFGYVLRHLLGDRVSVADVHLQKMTAFLLDVSVELEPGHGLGPDDIDVQFGAMSDDVSVARTLEMLSDSDADAVEDPRYVRRVFTGTVEGAWHDGTFKESLVPFELHVPGYAPRRVEAVVRPTWSTFVDVRLDRQP